jgi:phage FluMu protein gp41
MAATKTGTLKHGLKVGEVVHKDFEMREAITGDMFAAEAEADSSRPVSYQGALICQQLVRIGTFTGPFTLSLLGKLKIADFNILASAQRDLDAEGEDEQPG